MRKCLSPFFIGREELNLNIGIGNFDVVLNPELNGYERGSKNIIGVINSAIRDFTQETIEIGRKPLILSGDCLSAIGCLAGVQKCNIEPQLIWFDAHGDFHTAETTISGHMGGMPLAMISGRGDQALLQLSGMRPLTDEKIILVGGRDLENGEKEALEASRIRRVDTVTEILSGLSISSPIWIHFDTDYINPISAPAQRYPAIGGFFAEEIKLHLQALNNSCNIVGLSISAWAPHLDVNGKTASTCWDVISAISLV